MTEPASSSTRLETIAIAGVGLIGGSIAAAVKRHGFTGRVVGVGRSRDRLEAARRAGLIDAGETDIRAAARDADLLISCTPVDRIADDIIAAAAVCRAGALLTDAGSVKQSICQALAGRIRDGVIFIGSHPLAGSEKQGFEYADANLFDGRTCVITPEAASPAEAVARLTGFWQSIGMNVVRMSPSEHDRALAQTSHLPHAVAAALAVILADENRRFAATGYRDTTRIAAGDPELWTAILLANADGVLAELDAFSTSLAQFRAALATRDAVELKRLLAVAKSKRDAL